ncbi:low-specificity L-threonine aldolase [Epibacterium ulvae]|uniref:low-specificity L-threonine aldolase n=1 Tax=Epibacterium ulvae TaxID=1156985 RepID=UPI001BFBFD1E|nr:low-specificity L-threonine aldolase [Epibacterium ulvae]MBT8155358.1 low-specificity L-threonine aldolase [Epibacterium ulvae]
MSQYSSKQSLELGIDTQCDLRSDTVTRPDAAMRAVMAEAEVGDDVYGEDPSIARLEATLAERLGKDAALFLPSGTQSNLIAMLAHCGRGEEVITGRDYHVYKYEAGGASVLGGCVLDPRRVEPDGGLCAADIAKAIKADDAHHPISRLLSLENTHNGMAVPLARCVEVVDVARAAGLSTHLDGARFFNATVALQCGEKALAAPFDTVSICLSKGLGAPVGSVLVGRSDLIGKGRRLRKILGGGMRQAGVLAAAGLYALEHNTARLADDHARAAELKAALATAGITDVRGDTNMLFLRVESDVQERLVASLTAAGVKINFGENEPLRLVLHKDVTDVGFAALLSAVRSF